MTPDDTVRLAELALPVPAAGGVLTYELPRELWAEGVPGRRALVPLGPRKLSGVILSVRDGERDSRTRSVLRLLDDAPLMSPEVIELCRFAAQHYLHPLGLAVRGALPPGLDVREKLSAQVTDAGRALMQGERTLFGDDPSASESLLRTRGLLLRVEREEDVSAEQLRALEKRGLVTLTRKEAAARVQAPMIDLVAAAPGVDAQVVARAPKQKEVLDWLLARAKAVPLEEVLAAFPGVRPLLKKLEQRALIVRSQTAAGALAMPEAPWGKTDHAHTPAQAQALATLTAAIDRRAYTPFLLHGVTGSGKTHVYLEAIAAARAQDRGALVLVPEIALTPQLAGRFRARFGDDVAVLHSGLKDSERLSEWLRVLEGRAGIVVGARSAVFAPVQRLGIVVVDEEHEPSYKSEERLRFHARDLALVRAQKIAAVCVLGSATPSLESLQRAAEGKLTVLSLPERVDARPLPEVQLVDRKALLAAHDGPRLIGGELHAALRDTLGKGEQAILFLNRRGHSRTLWCRSCGAAVGCPNCSVALVQHQRGGARLLCHLCGHAEPPRSECVACGAEEIVPLSAGTERLEEELAVLLPGARVGRLDRDAVTSAGAAASLLARFARRELDVLAGTQMVAKGHDFPGVTLVGVLDADGPLHQPDFRAAERTLQLLLQVAGRAGRGDRPGRVILQALRPNESVLLAAQHHDWLAFAREELERRRTLGFSPFARMCALLIQGNDESHVEAAASRCAQTARNLATRGEALEVLGPAPASLARLRGKHRWQVLLRAKEHGPLQRVARRLLDEHTIAGTTLAVDVDPVSFG
ncbi:MAG: primosomal protein N' [Deltaproteobacteria bacterium]|nr:primosomal protein N' [Deltaproteobacteria bacterium]